MDEQISKNRQKTIDNIRKIVLAEIDECIGNFVDNRCSFSGFGMGDMFFTNPDTGEISTDQLGVFLLGGKNMQLIATLMKFHGDDDKVRRILEIANEDKE